MNGDNAFAYFLDAAGNTVEYTTGMSQLDPTWEFVSRDITDPAVIDVWGNGATSVAIVSLTEADAELVTWLLYSEAEASPAVSMVLELAALIDAECISIADAMRAL